MSAKKGIKLLILLVVFISLTGCKKKSDEKPVNEMTVVEKLKTLKINGQEIELPCKIGDLSDGLQVGDGSTIMGITGATLLYNGQDISAFVYIHGCNVGIKHVDMSTGYEDKWIYAISLDDISDNNTDKREVTDFEIASVNQNSTYDEILQLWGEPTIQRERLLSYEQGTDKSYILIFFNKDGKTIMRVSFSYDEEELSN